MNIRTLSFAALTAALALSACSPKTEQSADNASQAAGGKGGEVKLLNVSYDVARDFYKEYNPLFVKEFAAKNGGQTVEVQQSHGGSSKQALAVANGLAADVVTMNQTSDIELLVKKGLVKADWNTRLPDNAVPYTSNVVFLVRKGNPKHIQDWGDLAKDGDEGKTKDFVAALLKNTPVFENGGRAATTTFSQRNIGDVLVTFENEANYVSKKLTQDQFEIVYPSYTILSEAPVAVVDSVVDKKGTRATAEAYLQNLWSEQAQELAANLYLRPRNAEVLAKHKADFPEIETFNPNEKFGSWEEIMKKFFADGGLFDQLSSKK